MDRWQTKSILFEGGLIQNQPPLQQGITAPGSLIQAVNFEPSLEGGYRRISGYLPYDGSEVPGTDEILGVAVFNAGVVACRSDSIYFSQGAGWTLISTDTRTSGYRYRTAEYSWIAPTLVLVNGVDAPVKWDGTTYTVLSTAPVGASSVVPFKNQLFFGTGNKLINSAPYDDTDYTSAGGSVEINVGHQIEALAVWRDELYIFAKRAILKLVGSTYADFQLIPVTSDIGCVVGDSVQEIGGNLMFLGPDGIRTVAGTDRIGDVEIESVTRPIQSKVNNVLNEYRNGYVSSVIVRSKSQYRLFMARSDIEEESSRGILGGLRLSQAGLGFEWFELQGIKPSCAHSAYVNDDEVVVHGGYDGFVYRQEQGSTFNGNPVYAMLQTPYLTFDDPRIRKTLYKASLHFKPEGLVTAFLQTLYDFDKYGVIQPDPKEISFDSSTASAYDNSETIYDDTPPDLYNEEVPPIMDFNLIGSGFNSSLIFWSTGTGSAYTLKSIDIEYGLGGRR